MQIISLATRVDSRGTMWATRPGRGRRGRTGNRALVNPGNHAQRGKWQCQADARAGFTRLEHVRHTHGTSGRRARGLHSSGHSTGSCVLVRPTRARASPHVAPDAGPR